MVPVEGPPREANISRIGLPILFASGPYAGQTISMLIVAMCVAQSTRRRFAKRDRRPLDPPPVVRLRMYQVFNADSEHPTEQEISPDQVEVGGLVCHVDLFAIRPTPFPHVRAANADGNAPLPSNFEQATLVTAMPPSEENKVTDSLFGTTFSVASQIKGLDGDEVIFYVFSDLSVRTEGFRMEGSEDIPVLAETYGGPFAIYSTKEFPGLRASTELTKHLSRYGIRVNLREAERKRKPVEPVTPAVAPAGRGATATPVNPPAAAAGASTSGKGQQDEDEDEEEEEDEDLA
ncbi:velvet factor-domain-containing protein [Hysterangium stoloniferum]|nr:velvet factor-domain-containing protein [Hysterangium stoloniferum]